MGGVPICGRFKIDQERQLITHYPEVAWKPNFEHTTQPRPYALEHDRLTLPGHEEEETRALTYSVVWQRAKIQDKN
jgi:Lipocalin-like domain